ncbi:hypothetical protein [Bradyrhizobium neotropicale]|uniref:hypothetical protein n=1 Tax=Bradyrhizobium neotropicale TaxID=1497615 RepID=UPI001AD7A6CB|nr:hypothetical protein [Bradyrhizobium neotropicale]
MTAMPLHLLRLEVVNFIASGDRRMCVRARRPPRVLAQGYHRRGLRRCGKRRRTSGSAQRNLQKVAAFHEHCPFLAQHVMPEQCCRREMNAR